MRVISQDGTLDFPYENSIVFIDTRAKEATFVRMQAIGDNETSITAKYSTKEKAKKAMEMLRIAYTGSIAMFQNVETTEEVNEVFKKCNTQVIYASLDNQPSEIKFENHQNFYFQFPAEEELE
jgi:alkyl hydroperoxide reductase subunit AhpC